MIHYGITEWGLLIKSLLLAKLEKQVSEVEEIGYSSIARSVNWSQLNRACTLVTGDKAEGKATNKQEATGAACSIRWYPQVLEDFYLVFKIAKSPQNKKLPNLTG